MRIFVLLKQTFSTFICVPISNKRLLFRVSRKQNQLFFPVPPQRRRKRDLSADRAHTALHCRTYAPRISALPVSTVKTPDGRRRKNPSSRTGFVRKFRLSTRRHSVKNARRPPSSTHPTTTVTIASNSNSPYERSRVSVVPRLLRVPRRTDDECRERRKCAGRRSVPRNSTGKNIFAFRRTRHALAKRSGRHTEIGCRAWFGGDRRRLGFSRGIHAIRAPTRVTRTPTTQRTSRLLRG